MQTVAGKKQIRPGVLALQGGFVEHKQILQKLGYDCLEVRTGEDLAQVTHLIIPGGESTVMSKFLWEFGLAEAIIARVKNEDLAIMGTCAGAIVLANEVVGDQKVRSLKLLECQIQRNAYGRQLDSFVTEQIEFQGQKIAGMLIRAPRFLSYGIAVQVLASLESEPMVLRSGRVLVLPFHPELVSETAVHRYFLEEV